MRSSILAGFCGAFLTVMVLVACGSSSSALTQSDLDAQVAQLQQQIDALQARLDAHEPDVDAHQPLTSKLGLNYCIALSGAFPNNNLTAGVVAGDEVANGLSASDPLLGSVGLFAGTFAPRGWAFCEGQLLPINSNQALFSILGTTYGGDGRTTFALPDLRGRVPVHPDGTIRLGSRVP